MNILVHDNKLMIADFGLAKHLTVDHNSNSKVYGRTAYMEPQCFLRKNYTRNKKSDIYGLGVLLWEITSGCPPFLNIEELDLYVQISKGDREQPIKNTPLGYIELYQECWDNN